MESQSHRGYSVVVDSPLAVEATRIFAKNTKYFDDEATEYIRKHGKLPQNATVASL